MSYDPPCGSGGQVTYTYDAENRLISVVGGTSNSTYTYDALGHRVKKTGNSNECGSGSTIYYLYDLADRAVVHVPSGGTNNCQDEVYGGGRHLAMYGNPGLVFVHSDWLGTERAFTNAWGGTQTCASLPFGDNLACNFNWAGPYGTPLHFTGKERDSESGLDNFGARFNTSALGRFMTPDWSDEPDPIPYAKLDNPQSLNLYTYAFDNPTSAADDGHELCAGGLPCSPAADPQAPKPAAKCSNWLSCFLKDLLSGPGSSGIEGGAEGGGLGGGGGEAFGYFDSTRCASCHVSSPAFQFAHQEFCVGENCMVKGEIPIGAPQIKGLIGLAESPATRDALLQVAKNPTLRNIIKNLYRQGAKIGDGGTADAIREEIQTGAKVGGKDHFLKGLYERRALQKLLADKTLNPSDRAIVKRLLTDVQSALSSATK